MDSCLVLWRHHRIHGASYCGNSWSSFQNCDLQILGISSGDANLHFRRLKDALRQNNKACSIYDKLHGLSRMSDSTYLETSKTPSCVWAFDVTSLQKTTKSLICIWVLNDFMYLFTVTGNTWIAGTFPLLHMYLSGEAWWMKISSFVFCLTRWRHYPFDEGYVTIRMVGILEIHGDLYLMPPCETYLMGGRANKCVKRCT